ncbi:hypothetical protein K438DRAFT_1748544 [Mycena galopus ATCC 62051]|nr:hypothetical protein K438DRAFT_1748544 [Mycena galopus ATCC 62051]
MYIPLETRRLSPLERFSAEAPSSVVAKYYRDMFQYFSTPKFINLPPLAAAPRSDEMYKIGIGVVPSQLGYHCLSPLDHLRVRLRSHGKGAPASVSTQSRNAPRSRSVEPAVARVKWTTAICYKRKHQVGWSPPANSGPRLGTIMPPPALGDQ